MAIPPDVDRLFMSIPAEINKLKNYITEKDIEIKELTDMVDALGKKLNSVSNHTTCACSLDSPDDVRSFHSPKLRAAEQEIKRLQTWINDLQAQCWINCVYCGHRYGPDTVENSTMADALHAHIAECKHHPLYHMRLRAEKAEKEVARIRKRIAKLPNLL